MDLVVKGKGVEEVVVVATLLHFLIALLFGHFIHRKNY